MVFNGRAGECGGPGHATTEQFGRPAAFNRRAGECGGPAPRAPRLGSPEDPRHSPGCTERPATPRPGSSRIRRVVVTAAPGHRRRRLVGSASVYREGLLPAIGFGTAPLGGFRTPVSEDAAAAAIEAALEVGYRYFDTAPLYGYGLAERRLGRALKGCDADVKVSTKVGRIIDPEAPRPPGDLFAGDCGTATFDFSADGVRRSLEASFERMDCSYVDVAFIHDPDDHPRQALAEAYPALEQLRAEGAVGAIGVGMNRPGLPTRFVTETDIDAVLIAGRYTLLDREADEGLFGAAKARGVHLVAGGVYNSGVLTGSTGRETFNYLAAP
ncbi:MAG: aldo/keto reductase, partial [Acidimicrobiia bacterium]|nr:aldo/keto reductase [Acidimicrobiia bacterium]